MNGALKDPAVNDRSTKGIVLGIEDQCRQRRFRVALGGWNPLNNGLENLFDSDSLFGRTLQMRKGVQSQFGIDLFNHALHIGCRKINLIDDRNDGEVIVHREKEIGNGLGLDALSGVYQKKDPFAGGKGS